MDADWLESRAAALAAEREWNARENPKNLAMAMAGAAGILLERFRWISEEESRRLPPEVRGQAAQEVAETMLYALRLADKLGFDLWGAIEAQRGHGGSAGTRETQPAPTNGSTGLHATAADVSTASSDAQARERVATPAQASATEAEVFSGEITQPVATAMAQTQPMTVAVAEAPDVDAPDSTVPPGPARVESTPLPTASNDSQAPVEQECAQVGHVHAPDSAVPSAPAPVESSSFPTASNDSHAPVEEDCAPVGHEHAPECVPVESASASAEAEDPLPENQPSDSVPPSDPVPMSSPSRPAADVVPHVRPAEVATEALDPAPHAASPKHERGKASTAAAAASRREEHPARGSHKAASHAHAATASHHQHGTRSGHHGHRAPAPPPPSRSADLDIDQAKKLLKGLSTRAERVKKNEPAVRELGEELETLRRTLYSVSPKNAWIADSLKTLRRMLEEVVREALGDDLRASEHIKQIDALLGS